VNWIRPRRRSWELRVRSWVHLTVLAALPAVAADLDPRPSAAGRLPSEFALIVTGGELLDGSIGDAHTPFIARTLRPLGLRCVRSILVDDTAEDLESAFREATQHADLVLTTGGLGPTANDRTREALTAFTAVRVREDPDVLRVLAERFGQSPDQLRDNLRRQALVPAVGGYLPNDHGTAVGLIYEAENTTFIALPGPPRELQPMVTEQLVPWFRTRLGLPEQGVSATLRFVGIGQSAIDATLRGHVTLPAHTVTSSRFEGSRVDFTFSLPEDTRETRAQLARLTAVVTEHLGRNLYATNGVSLEQVVWARLATRGTSLVLAEARGPHLASAFAHAHLPESARITSIASRSERALGTVLGLPVELWEGLSEPPHRVEALGAAARRLTGSDWALVVGEVTGTGERRGKLWVALGHPDGTWDTWSLGVRESPETGWPGVVDAVLDRLRLIKVQPSTQRMATPSTIR